MQQLLFLWRIDNEDTCIEWSPRLHGNTSVMVDAFVKGVRESKNHVDVINVCQKKHIGLFGL